MKTKRVLALLLAPFLLAAGPAGASTPVTTNVYASGSTSDDIALACRDLSVVASTGVLSAACNQGDADGETVLHAASIDLDSVLYCQSNDEDEDPIVSIAWGSKTSDYAPAAWSVAVSSNGSDYHATATCRSSSDMSQAPSQVDLGDTTSGLKNDDGSLAGR